MTDDEHAGRNIIADRAAWCGLYESAEALSTVVNSPELGPLALALMAGRCVVAVRRVQFDGTEFVRTIEWLALPPGVGPFSLPPTP